VLVADKVSCLSKNLITFVIQFMDSVPNSPFDGFDCSIIDDTNNTGLIDNQIGYT